MTVDVNPTLRRVQRSREEHIRAMIFEQLPMTVRPNVEVYIARDLFDLKMVITLRVIGRQTGSSFEVDHETARDSDGILHVRVPESVVAELCVLA